MPASWSAVFTSLTVGFRGPCVVGTVRRSHSTTSTVSSSSTSRSGKASASAARLFLACADARSRFSDAHAAPAREALGKALLQPRRIASLEPARVVQHKLPHHAKGCRRARKWLERRHRVAAVVDAFKEEVLILCELVRQALGELVEAKDAGATVGRTAPKHHRRKRARAFIP